MTPVTTTTLTIFLSHLVASLPLLLVCVGGIILAIVWRRRAPRAAAFTLAGLALTLIVALAGTAAQAYLIATQPPATIGTSMAIVSILSSVLRALGMALVVLAVFAGRTRAVGSGFDVTPAAQPPRMAGLAPQTSAPRGTA